MNNTAKRHEEILELNSHNGRKNRKMKKVPFLVIELINVVLLVIPFALIWYVHYEPQSTTVHSKQVSCLMLIVYTSVFYYMGEKLDGFQVSIKRISELIFSQVIAIGVTDFVAYILIWMVSIHSPNLWYGFVCFVLQCIMISLICKYSHKVFFATHPPKKAVVVYDLRQGMEELITAYGLEKRYLIEGVYPIEDIIDSNIDERENMLKARIGNAENVFLCGIHTHDRNIILKYCIFNNIKVSLIPRMGDMIMASAERIHMFHLPFLRVTRYAPPKEYLLIKRSFDIVVSGLGLLIFSPIMIVVALMVKSDGGPALYKQIRLTKDGREFKILKFRSMKVDAEKYSGAVWSAGENDPRITKVGHIIRACRLDELPQLWNILVGEMSIVGPRPERPELAKVFENEFPEFALRLQCKAGLTGYAQVYGKYNTTPYDKTLMDLMYIANPSILEDLVIILETVKTIFSKEATEGVGVAETELKYEVRNKK